MSNETPLQTQTGRHPKPTLVKGAMFTLVMGLILAGLLFAASLLRSPTGPQVAVAEPEPLSVQVAPIELAQTFDVEESFSGLAQARRTSALGFSTGGRIDALMVRVGDRVTAGATLARLDTRGLRAQLSSANAVVEEARAAHSLAVSTVERQRLLRAQGHVAQQRVDEAEAQTGSALARIDAAASQADTLKVQIDLAQIIAPFAGVITARMADEGTIAAPGQPIFELVETGFLEVTIGVSSAVLPTLVVGQTYSLQTDAGTVDGRLARITGVVDARQRTVPAIFEVENPDLVPVGSVVRLKLVRQMSEEGFWVPLKALSSASRGLWSVYVASGDSQKGWRAEPRVVEMVYTNGKRAFVRGPISVGDRIIIDGLQRVTPGSAVLPREIAQTVSGTAP